MISFKKHDTDPKTNGYIPKHIIKAESEQEINGAYTGLIILPISALKDAYLKNRIEKNMIVKMGSQLYRITDVEKTLREIFLYLLHISCDLANTLPLNLDYSGFSTSAYALEQLKSNTQDLPFSLSVVYGTYKANFEIKPTNILDNLLGADGFAERFKVEAYRDNYNITFKDRIGSYRKVTAVYGKNIRGMRVRETDKDIITKIYPVSKDGIFIEPVSSDRAKTNKTVERIVEFDIKQEDEKTIKEEDIEYHFPAVTADDVKRELRDMSSSWFSDTNADLPKKEIEIDLLLLENTEEYKDVKGLEAVYLGDVIDVADNPTKFETGTSESLRVMKITKDELTKKNSKVVLSNTGQEYKQTSSASIMTKALKQASKIMNKKTDSLSFEIEQRMKESSDLIKAALGGHVVKRDGELLIMDTDSVATATKVWRWNLNGLGYSSTGVDGEYRTAMTMDGAINADFITAGSISGNIIKGGVIEGQYLKIDNTTKFADGYDPNEIRQEFSVANAQLTSKIGEQDKKISSIEQTEDRLTARVEDATSGENLVTELNLVAGKATLKSNLIDLDGYVTTTALEADKYVRAPQLTTSVQSERVGVGTGNVNNGKFEGNRMKTDSGSNNYINIENQFIEAYKNKDCHFEIGFLEQNSRKPIPYLRMGKGQTNSGWILKEHDKDRVIYGYHWKSGKYSGLWAGVDSAKLVGETYLNSRFVQLFNGYVANTPYFDYKDEANITNAANCTLRFSRGGGITLKEDEEFAIFDSRGVKKHIFYFDGSKAGGSVEVDGKNLGMSPIDSPQMLLEDIYIDVEIEPEGTKIKLNDTFKKTIKYPYAVFASNGAECIEKTRHYFILRGAGKVDVRVVGNRTDDGNMYYKDLTANIWEEQPELKNGAEELNSFEELEELNNKFFA